MKDFEYVSAADVKNAAELKGRMKGARYYAGGTDILIRIKKRVDVPKTLIDIKKIKGINKISAKGDEIIIGAGATMNSIAENDMIRKEVNVLAQCAWEVGSYQIRNLATIGGNICNAAPSADISPALLVLNAEIIADDGANSRVIPIAEFFKGPGKTALKDGEVVTAIKIKKPGKDSSGKYNKLQRVGTVDLAIVGVAALSVPNKSNKSGYDIRIALGAVAPTPIRVPAAERILTESVDETAVEKAALAAQNTAKPISDVRATAEYRKDQVYILTKRAINIILGREV